MQRWPKKQHRQTLPFLTVALIRLSDFLPSCGWAVLAVLRASIEINPLVKQATANPAGWGRFALAQIPGAWTIGIAHCVTGMPRRRPAGAACNRISFRLTDAASITISISP